MNLFSSPPASLFIHLNQAIPVEAEMQIRAVPGVKLSPAEPAQRRAITLMWEKLASGRVLCTDD